MVIAWAAKTWPMEPPHHSLTTMSLNPQAKPPANPPLACCTSFPLQRAWVGEDHPHGTREAGERQRFVSPGRNHHLPQRFEKYRGSIQISKFNAKRRDCPSGDRSTSQSVGQPQGKSLISPGTAVGRVQENRGTMFQRTLDVPWEAVDWGLRSIK